LKAANDVHPAYRPSHHGYEILHVPFGDFDQAPRQRGAFVWFRGSAFLLVTR